MKKFFAGLAATAAFVVAVSPASAAGILDGVDILNISGIYESSMSDGNMSSARSTLINEGASISDVGIGAFSAASLAGIDILYVGLVNNGFDAGQLLTIKQFVDGGGGLVSVGTERACCFGPSWEQVANTFGLSGLGGDRGTQANPAAPTSPIVDGPFGVATSYAPSATGAFNPASLPGGTTVVWRGVDDNPIIVTLNTNGRAFFFGDTNFMENGIIEQGDNRTIWGNAFAFTGNVVTGVPEPSTWAMMILGFFGLGAAVRGSRRRSAAVIA